MQEVVDDEIDGLDANERHHQSAKAVNEQVPLKHFARAERFEFDAPEREQNQERR